MESLESSLDDLTLYDGRAVKFLLQRIEVLKQENENLKSSPVETRVLQVARHLAKVSAGLIKPDFSLTSKLTQYARSPAKLDSLERLLHDVPSALTWRDDRGMTLLHLTASVGNVPACKMLIDVFHADLWACDLLGRTPLHLAAANQHLELCEFLTERSDARGERAPLDMAGCTPAALSALAANPYNENQKQSKLEFESKRKHVKRHLHLLGDSCISPRNPPRSTIRKVVQQQQHIVKYGFHLSNGWGVKMEDVLVVRESLPTSSQHSLFALFDGHGGALCAETCKKMLEEDSLLTAAARDVDLTDLPAFARKVCSELELRLSRLPEFELKQVETMQAIGQEKARYALKCSDESGTTLLLCLLSAKQACVAHVGDSRACLISKSNNSQDCAITRDHKLTIDEDKDFVQGEIARITRAGGFLCNNNTRVAVELNEDKQPKASLGMTRSIGDFWAKLNRSSPDSEQVVSAEPEIWQGPRGTPQYLLLASDGIWDVMTVQQVGAFVRERVAKARAEEEEESMILKRVAAELCDRCLEPDLDSQDNMSVIIVDLETQLPQQTRMREMNVSSTSPMEHQEPVMTSIRRPIFEM